MIAKFFYVANLIGVVAFAASGAIKGLKHKLDILGIVILSIITAVGGGMIRDVLLNKIPVALTRPTDMYVAIFTAMFVFILAKKLNVSYERKFIKELLVMDAIGLAIFTIIGAQVAIKNDMMPITVAILATLTGVGGGVIRDLLVNETPIILKEDIYAVLCIFGSIMYDAVHTSLKTDIISSILIFSVILGIRLVVIKYKLQLPK